mmetsp:Transcript_61191/g.132507  ORF Transcript_61191/g.132507 Transcript_61191/m.132507 type:complete len:267 (+) Transcript_61191:795-1595(+)
MLVLDDNRRVGHHLAGPLAKRLCSQRTFVDLRRRLSVKRKPSDCREAVDRRLPADVSLLSAIHRRNLQEVLEGVRQLDILSLDRYTFIVVGLVKLNDPRLVSLMDVVFPDLLFLLQLDDTGVVVDVFLRTRLTLLDEHHLSTPPNYSDVAIGLAAEVLPEHGLCVVAVLGSFFESIDSVLIVDLPLLIVTQDFVSSRDLNELGLAHIMLQLALVRVILQRLGSVRLLDFRLVGLLPYVERCVVVGRILPAGDEEPGEAQQGRLPRP